MKSFPLSSLCAAGLIGCGVLVLATPWSAAHAQTSVNKNTTLRATTLAQRRLPPPPPPVPSSDSTLALVSASASSVAAQGTPCAISADGSKVLFVSGAASLVSGDTNGADDIFLKDLNGNGVRRLVSTSSLNAVECLGMTPDAASVAFVTDVPSGVPNVLGQLSTERAIFVLNVATGQQVRVTPPRATFAAVDRYAFAGLSDNGQRVAFIAQPTRTCSGYDCTANGPARMLVRELGSGALLNLESQVRFTTSQGAADGEALLSPDGRILAFSSRAPYPEAGDTTVGSDVFALDLASGSVRIVSTDAAGRQLTSPGFFGAGPSFGVQAFLANSSRVAFFTDFDTSAGPGGVYTKDLNSQALSHVLPRNLTFSVGLHPALSFSDDGRRVAYAEYNSSTRVSVPRVRDLGTGATFNAATLTNGVASNGAVTLSVLLSRQGQSVAFGNNGTNLLGAALPGGGAEVRALRKLIP